ncbi:MAG: ABC transporter permease [Candidatus Sumerlaeota bacterium]
MTVDVSALRLALGYLLLLIPFGILLWMRVPILGRTALAVVRMTVQLLFVGFYLEVVFDFNSFWLTSLWLAIMIGVADTSILKGCRLKARRFAGWIALALLAGTLVPMLYFVGLILQQSYLLEARYAIPIGGMILGNCLRADIIGISRFYQGIRDREREFLHALAQGARLREATRPFFREALDAALVPTVATMTTIGLVSLPGMMTGVILGGGDPMKAIKYQIAIMIAIFTGTAITVTIGILLTLYSSFDSYGILDKDIFAD